jgi:hypothetical protein
VSNFGLRQEPAGSPCQDTPVGFAALRPGTIHLRPNPFLYANASSSVHQIQDGRNCPERGSCARNDRQVFHEAYCARQGLSPEEDCNVAHKQLRLLHETERVCVVLNESWDGMWPTVVDKETANGQCEMETIEL